MTNEPKYPLWIRIGNKISSSFEMLSLIEFIIFAIIFALIFLPLIILYYPFKLIYYLMIVIFYGKNNVS